MSKTSKDLNITPLHLFSQENMPLTDCHNMGELHWFASDNQQNFKKHPHPDFTETKIHYRFNTSGYRCPEFDLRHSSEKRAVHIVSIGSSEMMGIGLPEEYTYTHLIKEKLQSYLNRPTYNWNLSLYQRSSDYISRTLMAALSILKPDLVLLTFPGSHQWREYISEQARIIQCTSSSPSMPDFFDIFTDIEKRKVFKAHRALASPYNDLINFQMNYQFCQSLCEKSDIMWLFSATNSTIFNETDHLIDKSKFVYPGISELEIDDMSAHQYFSRDFIHPGIEANRIMAELFFSRLKSQYACHLNQLRW